MLKDKKLGILPLEPFSIIEEALTAIPDAKERFEPTKQLIKTTENRPLGAVNSDWGQTRSDIITPLFDREYMSSLREKLNLIQDFNRDHEIVYLSK